MRIPSVVLSLIVSSVLLTGPAAQAQTRQDALLALQTIQSRCESGVNFDAFSYALDEAQRQLGEFFDSRESAKYPEFSDAVERALTVYQTSFVIWKAKVDYRQDFVALDHPTSQLLVNVYPDAASLFGRSGQASARELVSFFWDKAGTRTAEVKRMLSAKGRR